MQSDMMQSTFYTDRIRRKTLRKWRLFPH